ncbi:MAG: hypothetical protein FJZ58_03215, partial [Chlamydiae bacterium]|nr:hypothetical protein [Chlamydiota bacterium]
MSIRYHLLLIAGITTTVVFLASFFLESFLLNRSLDTAGKASEALYEKMFSKRMEYLTDFVQDALIERLAQVNALLRTVAQYKPLAEWFSPSLEHRQKGTWSSAASLIQQDDWISFLQNTTEQEELSLIAPSRGPFSFAQFVPVEEGIVFAYMPGEEKESFIGVQVVSKFLEVDQKDGDGLGTLGILPIVYALYTIDTLKALDFSSVEDSSYIPTPYTHGTEVDEQLFLKVLARAMDLVHAPGFHIPPFTGQITEITPSPVETLSFQQEVEMSLNKKLSYAGELFVIWQAGVLRECGAFGVKEFRLPDAMCFSATEGQGEVFFLSDVMGFAKRWFDDEQFYAKNPPSALTSLVSSGSEIIPGPKEGQAFLVNTAAIFEEEEQGKRRSLLTIG